MIRLPMQEYNKLLKKSGQDEPLPPLKPSKHRNIRQHRYADGWVSSSKNETNHGRIVQKYDSKKEYLRHMELQLLERTGRISDLECQKTLVVAEGFTDRGGLKHRAITYRADFSYSEAGALVIEDVKGFDVLRSRFLTTEAFSLKWKLLQARYPDYIFRLY